MRSTEFRSSNIDSSVSWQTMAFPQMASTHYPMNELQQVQLRAQILVYGALLEGSLPEEALMIGSFSDTTEGLQESSWDDGRLLWEKAWVTALQRAQGMPSATCQEGTRAKLDTLRPSFPSTSALIESMPTATRTSLSALHPISNLQGFQEESAAGISSKNARARRSRLLGKSRKRKKIHFFQTEPGGESIQMHDLDMEQAELYVENAESVAASILEHSESLHALLQVHTSDTDQQAEVASAAIAMGAAASAAKASATAAKIAYEAALQAKRIADSTIQSFNHASGPPKKFPSNEQFKVQDYTGVACALELVLKAVSQAETAMETGNSRPLVLVGGSRDRRKRGSERNQQLTEVEMDALQEKQLAEGVSVEVMSRKSGFGGAWFTAKVLDVKDGIVYVLYDERFDDNDDYLKEWLPIKGSNLEPVQAPRIRFPHPVNEKDKKTTKFWMVGDHVDVCIGHGWKEGIITSVSSEDCNNMTVFFPGEGNTVNAKSSDLRPSLLWQDNGWVLWQNHQIKCAQLEEDAASNAELNSEMITEIGETGPPTSHKMRNLIDLILEETKEGGKPKQMIRKGDERSKVSQVERSKRRKSLTNGTSNGHGKKRSKLNGSKVASKVRKAKKLIEKASKPFNLQVSGSRLTRQFIQKLASASASGDASKVMLAKGHQMLRELVRLKASSRKASFTLPQSAATAEASQQRPRRLVQPTSKLLEGLQSALEGGKTALLF